MNPLRMQNIFGQQPRQPNTSYPRLNNSPYPMYNEFLSSIAPMRMARIKQQQDEEGRALDAQQQASQRPIAAPLIPQAAQQPAQQPMDVKYNPGINPYQAAQIDLQNRKLAAASADDVSDNKLAQFRIDETNRKNLATEKARGATATETNRKNLELEKDRERRTIVAEFGMKNPNVTLTRTPQGILATDRTGKAAYLKDKDGNVISSGMMSDADEMAQGQTNRERNIGLQGDQTRQTQAARPELASNQHRAAVDRAVKVRNMRPEWQEFITVENGNIKVTPTGDPIADEQIRNAIYGEARDINLPGGTNAQPTRGAQPKKDPWGIR